MSQNLRVEDGFWDKRTKEKWASGMVAHTHLPTTLPSVIQQCGIAQFPNTDLKKEPMPPSRPSSYDSSPESEAFVVQKGELERGLLVYFKKQGEDHFLDLP
jgi:hypothetical protein